MTDDVRYAIAVLSLFKALPETKPSDKKADNAENISYGFFLMDDAVKKCSVATNYEVLAFIRGKYGYDAVAMNRGLHRSFREVAETSEEKLFIQQMQSHALWRDVKIAKGTSLNQVKPVRVLDTPVKEKFFYGLLEQAEE